MSPRFSLYRDALLLHTGVFLAMHEVLTTPPPFDVTVATLAAALCGLPVTNALDKRRRRSSTQAAS